MAVLSRRPTVAVLAKVNQRGKVTSRPGPTSPKQMKQQKEAAKKQQQGQQQQQEAITTAAEETAASSSSIGGGSFIAGNAVSSPSSSPSSSSSPATSSQPQRITPPVRTSTETPQVVVDRMFGRMIGFAATPVFLGIALLVVFYYLKLAQGDDFPMGVVYMSQGLAFGGGLLGISYGILSTSWDPAREGSFLGWTEFQANLSLLLQKKDKQ